MRTWSFNRSVERMPVATYQPQSLQLEKEAMFQSLRGAHVRCNDQHSKVQEVATEVAFQSLRGAQSVATWNIPDEFCKESREFQSLRGAHVRCNLNPRKSDGIAHGYASFNRSRERMSVATVAKKILANMEYTYSFQSLRGAHVSCNPNTPNAIPC